MLASTCCRWSGTTWYTERSTRLICKTSLSD